MHIDNGTTVCNPNCGLRVTDDYAPGARKRWLVSLLRSLHVSRTRGLSNEQFALVVFRCVVQGSFPSRLWSKARLADACGVATERRLANEGLVR